MKYKTLIKAILNFVLVLISFKRINIDGFQLKKNAKTLLKIIIFIQMKNLMQDCINSEYLF
jgi:hypothetical protein